MKMAKYYIVRMVALTYSIDSWKLTWNVTFMIEELEKLLTKVQENGRKTNSYIWDYAQSCKVGQLLALMD